MPINIIIQVATNNTKFSEASQKTINSYPPTTIYTSIHIYLFYHIF